MDKIIASAVRNVPHLAAFDDLAASRLESLDLTVLLMYVVDAAPEAALFSLAKQFNVLGWKGWNLCQTVDDRRELVKRAIELKKYSGTPWAVETSLVTVGFDGATVHEGINVVYDGTNLFDGDITFGAGDNWANFRVTVELPDGIVVDGPTLEKVVRLINEYKNARSKLVDVTFFINLSDELETGDEIDLSIFDADDNLVSNEQF